MNKLYSGITAALKRAAVLIPALCISVQLCAFPVAAYTGYELSQTGTDKFSEINVSLPVASQNINHGGYELKPQITTVSGANADCYKYQWYKKNGSGKYVKLPCETNETLIIGNEYDFCTLAVKVTPCGSDGSPIGSAKMSNSYSVYPLGKCGVKRLDDNLVNMYQNTPEENLFEVDGMKFILLDYSAEDENSAFYVMSENGLAQRQFDEDNLVIFDINNPKNIGYWLNNDFLNGEYLPDGIKNYIYSRHKWNIERPKDYSKDKDGKYVWADFSCTAPISLMGYSDYLKYFGKFGLRLPEYKYYGESGFNGWTGWWLRTSRSDNDIDGSVFISSHYGKDGKGISGTLNSEKATKSNVYVRPVFYLNRDFFKNVKLNARETGEFVKQAIRDTYDLSEMQNCEAAYTERELTALGYETEEFGAEFSVSITPGNDCYEFFKHDNAYYDTAIENTGVTARTVQLNYTVTPLTAGGQNAVVSEEVILPSGTTIKRIDLRDYPNGKYTIDISLVESGFEFYSKSFTMNLLSEVSGSDYRFVNVGADNTITEKDCKIMSEAGIKHIRSAITWDSIEKEKGVYNFDAFDKRVAMAEKYGIKITALLAYGNSLYTGAGTSDKAGLDSDEEQAAFVEYVRKTIARYPNLYAVEIWNEPNSTGFWNASADDYMNLAKKTIAEIRKINSTIPIYVGSIDISRSGIAFMQKIIDSNLYQLADGISYHPYFHPGTVENSFIPYRLNPYHKLLYQNGGWKTLPITEIGYETRGDASKLVTQARETVKSLIAAQEYHTDDLIVYCFRDTSHTPNSFGALDKNYNSTELLFALNQYMAELNDAVYLSPINAGNRLSAHLFLKGRDAVVAVWSKDSAEHRIEFDTPVTANDYFGNPLTVTDNSVLAGQNPVYIKGMGFDYIKSAVTAELESLYSKFSSKYTVEIPNYASSLEDKDSIKNLIITHYRNGLGLRNTITDDNKFYGALYHWNYIGELLVRYYSLFADEKYIGTVQRAANYLENTHNQYARSIAGYALNMAKRAERFSKSNMPSEVKRGYSAAYDLYAGILMSYANYFDGHTTDADVKQTENGLDIRIWANTDKVSAQYYMAAYDVGGKLRSVSIIPFEGNGILCGKTETVNTDISEFASVKLFGFDNSQRPLNNPVKIK